MTRLEKAEKAAVLIAAVLAIFPLVEFISTREARSLDRDANYVSAVSICQALRDSNRETRLQHLRNDRSDLASDLFSEFYSRGIGCRCRRLLIADGSQNFEGIDWEFCKGGIER